MVNLLGFLPKEYTKNKKLKIAEKCFYYIMLIYWAMVCVMYSDVQMLDVRMFFIIVCVVEIVLSGKLYLDIRELLLVVGMGAYYGISGLPGGTSKVLIIFLAYYFGKSIILSNDKHYRIRVIHLFAIMAIGMAVGSILDFLSFVPVEGARITQWPHFWSEKVDRCTHYAFYIIPISCIIFWSLCTISQHILLSIILLTGAGYCNYLILKSYTRMGIVITFLCFIICALVFFIHNINKKKVRITYGIIAILVMLIGTVVISKLLNNTVLFETILSNIKRDNGLVGNVRFRYMMDVLGKLPSHFMGGIELEEGIAAHNVWVDMARVAGIIPFAIIVVYSAFCIYDAVKCLVKAKHKSGYEYVAVAIFIGFYLYYMIEPALDVSVHLWYIGCIVSGVIRAINIQKENNEKKKCIADTKRKYKSKKAKQAIVAVMMTMSIACTGCGAISDEEDASVADEYVDDGEYDDIALMGEGTKEDPYLINDYNDLIYLYNAVNTGWLFDDKYILQTNDIDMSGQPFWPIAEYTTPYSFLGTYDGGGHVIQNVCLYTEYYSAIFGKLGGTVMNLGIVDGYIEGWKAAGLVGICTSHDAKILNCYTITTLAGKETAGIVASASGMIECCFSESRLNATERRNQIALDGDGHVNRCYATWVRGTEVNNFYINDNSIWLAEDNIKSLYTTADELNESISNMADNSGIRSDEFCLWKVSDDGFTLRLSTEKAELMETSKDVRFIAFMQKSYPYSPTIISLIIVWFVVLSTIRVREHKR